LDYPPKATKPIRQVLARRGKKRQLAKLNAELKRLQCFVHVDTPPIESIAVESVTVEPDSIMRKIIEVDNLIQVIWDNKCTHLLVGPDFHRSLLHAPEMQFSASVRMAIPATGWRDREDSFRREVYGFIIVVVPWMSGYLPIQNPEQWPKAVI
jgi:hypothetical protein